MKFDEFDNVSITGIDVNTLDDEQKEVLYHQAKYCQAIAKLDKGVRYYNRTDEQLAGFAAWRPEFERA